MPSGAFAIGGEAMLLPGGWFDWTIRDPGPAEKQYSQRNSARLYIPHSAVGNSYSAWRNGRLWNMERGPDGRFTDMAAASVHGWINKNRRDGTIQHYPIWVSCWASGSRFPNVNGFAWENQGGAPGNVNEPLSDYQVETNARIMRDTAEYKGGIYWRRPVGPADLTATLYEHRECVRFGSRATACPSERIPWGRIMELAMSLPTAKQQLAVIRALQPNLTAADVDAMVVQLRYLFLIAHKPWPP